MMKTPKLADVAYTAGIVDGEGSISLLGNSGVWTKCGRPAKSPMVVIQVSGTCRALLDWLLETWGAGTVIVGYRPKRPTHRTAYVWRIRNDAAVDLLKKIRPYMIVKGEQADLAIEYQQRKRLPAVKIGDAEMRERWAYVNRMVVLNGRVPLTEPRMSESRLHYSDGDGRAG